MGTYDTNLRQQLPRHDWWIEILQMILNCFATAFYVVYMRRVRKNLR